MMKLHSSHLRFPWDKELERTIGVGQTLFNLVNSSFFFQSYYANADEIRITYKTAQHNQAFEIGIT